ncbi:methylated-DNA--[protein]-cysteine S-methyltransferase [Clostridium sp. OS1-26]|uniref:methylated-DNA--[protein]-cysteine S-methyltransferase n=1 Tax=Clostridium sp. OS1-26 TaxID=3070681 RepID=UPI0027DFD354|nr:methylated-DNA--[protein]-cysteine S-methyltransferase [Clostridium sp. OS1-26]WML36379.1 methylated-DNA--[protein]-cysteine S-methyltransferase [Clostridium sp. OS1-26]
MDKIYTVYYKSPIGTIELKGNIDGVISLYFIEEDVKSSETADCLVECVNQLDEYFKGVRKNFSLKLNISGTEFREKVWNKLQDIPYGETCSYLDIAKAIGNEKAVRAVGGANHNNKISIIIPCHRVIGNSGSLTGYGGGLWRKDWLLNHEKSFKDTK